MFIYDVTGTMTLTSKDQAVVLTSQLQYLYITQFPLMFHDHNLLNQVLCHNRTTSTFNTNPNININSSMIYKITILFHHIQQHQLHTDSNHQVNYNINY